MIRLKPFVDVCRIEQKKRTVSRCLRNRPEKSGSYDCYREVILESYNLKGIIEVIRIEQDRRASLLRADDSDFTYDQWRFNDLPFVNEMCLMLLVTLRHEVERELIGLAALAAQKDEEISNKQYWENVDQLRKGKRWNWKKINERLNLEIVEQYRIMDALRHLVNLYKHDPSKSPNKELLKLLSLPTNVTYSSLSESDSLREGFAVYIGLEKDAGYCDIAEKFVNIANEFTSNIQSRSKLSRVKRSPVLLDARHSAR
jgi:hypothetical protein